MISKHFPEHNITAHRNGDYSGDVRFHMSAERTVEYYHGTNSMEVAIPFEVLKELVADKRRSDLIGQLEDATVDEILEM